MDKKTSIAVVVGILIVFVIIGGKSLLEESTSAISSDSSAQDQSATITNTNQNNTQDIMQPTDQTQSPNQLQMNDEVVGTGTAAVAGDTVTVNYVGTLTDGTKFDSSYDRNQPFAFTLGAGQVIQGWDMGVAGMKVGGKRILVIPSTLGYGAQDIKDQTGKVIIPANSTLIFQVELLSVGTSTSSK
jgi:FKBP-type peptidyl-prolyl cis-trans isomerase